MTIFIIMYRELANGIIIRSFTQRDIAAIHSLIMEFAAFQKSEDKVTVTIQQMQENIDLFQCLVAVSSDNTIIGFASYFYAYYSWSGKALYLDDLYVTLSQRGNGTGKALLDTIVEMARNSSCKKVRWQVSNWNKNGISFYRHYGAEIDEVEINCDYIL